MITSTKSTSKFIVIVSGGGPVGLTFSLNLAMMMCKKHVEIHIYEDRWLINENGIIQWRNAKQGNIRRDQVVTLQDHVIEQMPKYIAKGLFKNINERVWPTSRNIPIEEVEDRLLDLIQPFVQIGQIKLIPQQLNELSEELIRGEFDILIGADGSNSFVRRYCNIELMSEGIEYACGVAYNIPQDVLSEDQPLHQALNCILTLSQTRYLVNSSSSYHGYLNIRLTQSEYSELCVCLQMFETSSISFNFEDYKAYCEPSVWSIIRQGLDFFNIRQKFVNRIVPIEINVRHASILVRELRFEIKQTNENKKKMFKTMLACLVGDAAMNVHFWPGRGMNSGMKAAMALARNIFRSAIQHIPIKFNDLLDYEGFMARLRAREQQGRSLRILIDPIDKTIQQAYTSTNSNQYFNKYTNQLKNKLKKTRQNLEKRSDWPHKTRPVTDKELNDICHRISRETVAQLSLANPWPTREMSGIEILVQDTFPFDQQLFLSVPRVHKINSFSTNTHVSHQHYRLIILWITGNHQLDVENTNKLIYLIRTSSNLFDMNIQYYKVKTVKEAQQWIQNSKNLENILSKKSRFKVVTSWSIDEKNTAIDVIRVIRVKTSHTPILIISHKHQDTRLAREFPNVTTMNTLLDLYEFLEIKQPIQWNKHSQL